MDSAKLILEYLKVLVWPIVVICVLFIFSPELKKLVGRLTTASFGPASASFGSGKTKDERVSETPTHPDVWFGIRQTSLGRSECIEKARVALERNGFLDGAADPGGLVYGYTERFVGAISCGVKENFVLITVAGPKPEVLRSKYLELENAFFSGTP
jgi:hypothetical protein